MATFEVDVDYIITATEVSQDQVAVTFTLTCADVTPSLEREYVEVYPYAMYYQNIDPTMHNTALTAQMRGNFLTLARITLEEFAEEAKAVIRGDEGSTVDTNLTGTIALNAPVIYISFGAKPFTFKVTWN